MSQPKSPTPPKTLSDVQSKSDARNVPIDKVGVKDITYPIVLHTPQGGQQHTVAKVNMYVSLPHYQKGTHMSRFLEVLNMHAHSMSPDNIMSICHEIRKKLNAEEAHLELEFTYFIPKQAPATGAVGLMDYQVRFECTSNGEDDFIMGVRAPATSLCPCSKDISAYGAHNQRCMIEARVRTTGLLWIEELVEIIEGVASAPVYSVLKRPDEKFVTEQAYDNPKFVEDIVRDLALKLNKDKRIAWYSINSENYESIHNHSAYASIERDKRSS